MVSHVREKDVSVRLNEDLIARLDKIAGMIKVSRRHLMKDLLALGVEEVEDLQDSGALQNVILARDLQSKLSDGQTTGVIVRGGLSLPVRIDEAFLLRLDRLAKRAGLSRQQLMKNILLYAVKQTEALAKLKAINLFDIIRELPKSLGEVFNLGEKVAN